MLRKQETDEDRKTVDQSTTTEDNAPLPVPASSPTKGIKRENESNEADNPPNQKAAKLSAGHSPTKSPSVTSTKTTRSATSNSTSKASPTKSDGSQKITSFLKKS